MKRILRKLFGICNENYEMQGFKMLESHKNYRVQMDGYYYPVAGIIYSSEGSVIFQIYKEHKYK